MSTRFGPIAKLNRELEIHCREGRDRPTLVRLRREGIDLAAGASLADVVEGCHTSNNRRRTDKVLWLLVAQAVMDETAVLALLVALRPALLALTSRLLAVGMGAFEAQTAVVSTAYERIFDVFAMRSTHVARAIVGGTWDRVRSSLKAEQRCALRQVGLDGVGDIAEDGAPADPTEPAVHLSPLLRDAVAARVISPEAGCVIHATRVEERSFDAVAHQLGKGVPAIRKTRQRGERALIDRGHRRRRATDLCPRGSSQVER